MVLSGFLSRLREICVYLFTGQGPLEAALRAGPSSPDLLAQVWQQLARAKLSAALEPDSNALEAAAALARAAGVRSRERDYSTTVLPRLIACVRSLAAVSAAAAAADTLSKTTFVDGEAAHEALLEEVWALLRPGVVRKPARGHEAGSHPHGARISPDWGDAGFQGHDPGTDFRGMGLLGLVQLRHYAGKHAEAARGVLARTRLPLEGYPLAITSIRVTALVKDLLQRRLLDFHLATACSLLPLDAEAPAGGRRRGGARGRGAVAPLLGDGDALSRSSSMRAGGRGGGGGNGILDDPPSLLDAGSSERQPLLGDASPAASPSPAPSRGAAARAGVGYGSVGAASSSAAVAPAGEGAGLRNRVVDNPFRAAVAGAGASGAAGTGFGSGGGGGGGGWLPPELAPLSPAADSPAPGASLALAGAGAIAAVSSGGSLSAASLGPEDVMLALHDAHASLLLSFDVFWRSVRPPPRDLMCFPRVWAAFEGVVKTHLAARGTLPSPHAL